MVTLKHPLAADLPPALLEDEELVLEALVLRERLDALRNEAFHRMRRRDAKELRGAGHAYVLHTNQPHTILEDSWIALEKRRSE